MPKNVNKFTKVGIICQKACLLCLKKHMQVYYIGYQLVKNKKIEVKKHKK